MDWKWLLFGFRGRINRAKYWLAILLIIVADIVLELIRVAAVLGAGQIVQIVVGLVVFLLSLPLIVANFAVPIKRLHDRDKSAWWLLLFYLAPGVLMVIAVLLGTGAAESLGMTSEWLSLAFRLCILAAIAIGVWAFIELGCLRGRPGSNRYGPDPLAPPMAPPPS